MPSRNRVSEAATSELPESTEVLATELHDHVGEWFYDLVVYPVPFKLSYASESIGPDDLVMIVCNSDGVDQMRTVRARTHLRVATDDELAAADNRRKRVAFARGLRAFADLVENSPDLPIRNRPTLDLGYAISRDELRLVSEAIGVQPEHEWNRNFAVKWRSSAEHAPGFSVAWTATYPQCPYVFDPQDIPGLDEPFAAKCVSWEYHDGEHKPEQLSKATASTKKVG